MSNNNIPYTLDELFKIASKYSTRNEFRLKSGGAYMSARRRFPATFNSMCSHMGVIIKPKQTMEDVHNEALAYTHFTEFSKTSAYMIMRQRFSEFSDEICEHLIRSGHNDMWTLELLEDEALNYTTKKEFQRANSGAYSIMYRRFPEFVDVICEHMSTSFNSNRPTILYYLSINNGQAYKIGITYRTVEQRFNNTDLSKIKVIQLVEYSNGKDAYSAEQLILKEFSFAKWDGDDLLVSGNTELFKYDVLNLDSNESSNDKKEKK